MKKFFAIAAIVAAPAFAGPNELAFAKGMRDPVVAENSKIAGELLSELKFKNNEWVGMSMEGVEEPLFGCKQQFANATKVVLTCAKGTTQVYAAPIQGKWRVLTLVNVVKPGMIAWNPADLVQGTAADFQTQGPATSRICSEIVPDTVLVSKQDCEQLVLPHFGKSKADVVPRFARDPKTGVTDMTLAIKFDNAKVGRYVQVKSIN